MATMEREINHLDIDVRNQRKVPAARNHLQKHAGSIIESIIRKKGHNISKLARFMKISRCTLYNWFDQDTLPFDVLIRVGSYINYDFSADFPELFTSSNSNKNNQQPVPSLISDNEKIDYWIKKYIHLLEKYNESLLNRNYLNESK